MAALALLFVLMLPLSLASADVQHLAHVERVAEFSGEGTLGEGDSKAFRFVVAQPNVTRVDFLLLWTETHDALKVSEPDRFSLAVTRPDGALVGGQAARSSEGRILVSERQLNVVPADGPVRADELEAQMRRNTGEIGMGEWRALVRLEDVGNPDGARVDTGNDFELHVVLHYYESVPMSVVSLEQPGLISVSAARGDPWGLALLGLVPVTIALAAWLAVDSIRRRRQRRVVELADTEQRT